MTRRQQARVMRRSLRFCAAQASGAAKQSLSILLIMIQRLGHSLFEAEWARKIALPTSLAGPRRRLGSGLTYAETMLARCSMGLQKAAGWLSVGWPIRPSLSSARRGR